MTVGSPLTLAAGDTIAQTQSAVVLEDLVGQFITSRADAAGTVPAPDAGTGK